VISCGLVRGISFIVRQMKKTSSPMKTIGAQVTISGSRLLQSYQWPASSGGMLT
jgi:hypothetical protein